MKPNDWGLYDMHGNAWEWCQDDYDPEYYQSSPMDDPPGGAGDSDGHVFRGGSWFDAPVSCRSAFRPCQASRPPRPHLGFRVLLVCPPGVRTESGAKNKPAAVGDRPVHRRRRPAHRRPARRPAGRGSAEGVDAAQPRLRRQDGAQDRGRRRHGIQDRDRPGDGHRPDSSLQRPAGARVPRHVDRQAQRATGGPDAAGGNEPGGPDASRSEQHEGERRGDGLLQGLQGPDRTSPWRNER